MCCHAVTYMPLQALPVEVKKLERIYYIRKWLNKIMKRTSNDMKTLNIKARGITVLIFKIIANICRKDTKLNQSIN